MKIKFLCPKCHHTRIEEIQVSASVSSPVEDEATYQGDGEIEFNYQEAVCNFDGELDRYQCQNCGYVIGKSSQELFDWLQEHGQVEFDENDAPIEEDEE